MGLRSILKLFFDAASMPDEDPRVVALQKYAKRAFGAKCKITFTALSNDTWAWGHGTDSEGSWISLDVRGGPKASATAALAAALQTIAEQRGAQQAGAARPEE